MLIGMVCILQIVCYYPLIYQNITPRVKTCSKFWFEDLKKMNSGVLTKPLFSQYISEEKAAGYT